MTEHNPNAIGIFGAGAWGTALALHLARQGRSVHLWAREAKVREAIRHDHINSVFLPGVRLPAKIEVVDAAAIDVPLPLKVLRTGRELSLSVKPQPLHGIA